ncbi:MAG: SIS domain-containing protein, partial [Candidatus Onthovivens sp.]|nr:SIS domain-containing protein [Candidatus Onthovivens sp.]
NNKKNDKILSHLDLLIERYKILSPCRDDIWRAYCLLEEMYSNGHKLLVAGNGGSAADSEHIVGELMKSFCKKRPGNSEVFEKMKGINEEKAVEIFPHLQCGLRAISLCSHPSLNTAYINDVENGGLYFFAQEVFGYGDEGDVLMCISTSGNSKNVVNAAIVAKTLGLKVVSLTGAKNSMLENYSDVVIKAPSTITHEIQEYHLPIYHCLCLMLEEHYF